MPLALKSLNVASSLSTGTSAVIIIGVPLAKKLLPLAVGVRGEIAPVSSAANAVTGNKLIAMHSDRNTAKIFFFTCVFLLLWIFFAGVRCPALDRTTSAIIKRCNFADKRNSFDILEKPLQTGRVCSMMNLHIHKSSTFGNVHHSKPPPTKKGPGIVRSRALFCGLGFLSPQTSGPSSGRTRPPPGHSPGPSG